MRASTPLGGDENGPLGGEMNECRVSDKKAEETVIIGKEISNINENLLVYAGKIRKMP